MLVAWLSSKVGATEPALRLLLSVLVAYPIVLCYRCFLYNNNSFTKKHTNILFATCGIAICIFNNGFEVWHSLLAVTFTYAIINLLHKSRFLVPVSFIFHMSYLLLGYYTTATENYDICWTMCHCVMVLHLIGLTFDVSDSVKNPEVLGITDDRPVKIPNLLEVFAFAYYPPTVIIGPQFSFKRYSNFLDKKFEGTKNLQHGFKRLLTGIVYLGIYQGLTFIVPDGYFLTPDFSSKNFLHKLILVCIWGRCTLYKYISCWILSEGAAICCGLTFVSRDEKTGAEDWSGCANIKLKIFENTNNFHDYVSAFNVQTNAWVFQYVYKRLKFLNNKNISHMAALLFLAVWHGFHPGYYMTFFMEFMLISFEKAIMPVFANNPKFQKAAQTIPYKIGIFVICKAYAYIIAGYCLIPFAYLRFAKWFPIYKDLYFIGHIVILPMMFVWRPLILKALKINFPLEKATADEKAPINEAKSNSHEKSN